MTRVRTASRLHFGLLHPGAGPGRRFGGVGLMVQAPGVCVSARPAGAWSAEGPLAARALEFARRIEPTLPSDRTQRFHLQVEHAAPDHMGLGTGTQLGLAVARVILEALELPHIDEADLARRVGRGARSGIGLHGFVRGGFLVDGGKGVADRVAPLVARAEFPDPWRLVLVLPSGEPGRHGEAEARAFQNFPQPSDGDARADRLCRLVLLGLLPALAERDLEAFGEAVYECNRQAGEAFALIQGGAYASPRVEEVIAFIRGQGVRGAGQSSWGPAVFAVASDEHRAEALADLIRRYFALAPGEVQITSACNRGASVNHNGIPSSTVR